MSTFTRLPGQKPEPPRFSPREEQDRRLAKARAEALGLAVDPEVSQRGSQENAIFGPHGANKQGALAPLPGGESSPTGRQWVIGHGNQEAIITEVGATLRSYRVNGHDVIDGFSENEWSPSGRGQILAPWPNRLGDGSYVFRGVQAQAALDEPDHGNAIHGLVRWLPFEPEIHAQNVIALTCDLFASPGYPFRLKLKVEYRLGRIGLMVTTWAQNPGKAPIPFGCGFHPYIRLGQDVIDANRLTLPVSERVVVDARGLPTGEIYGIGGTEYDFAQGRVIGHTRMDTPFTGLLRDTRGVARARLSEPMSDRSVTLWMDDKYRYLMCYTGDTLEDHHRRRRAIAIEPMTCPPDAFRSGQDIIELKPGQEWRAKWGIETA